MKNISLIIVFVYCSFVYGQIEQNVNTTNGTVSTLTNQISNIVFNGSTQMTVNLTDGTLQNYNLSDITNVTFSMPSYATGTVHCNNTPTAVVDVTNPATGKIWMDRNLGATQVATTSTDANSYGDLYQWGRRSDGHQCRTSPTTSTLSSTNTPANCNFILAPNSPYDWRSPQNTNLWQGVNGVNNPCPSGYRLPTETELNAERTSWSQNNSAGAFASPLKLPVAGNRNYSNGSLYLVGTSGLYWSSTVSSTNSRVLYFLSSNAYMNTNYRAFGFAVRCLKD
jgi:uncharacterized protein (TIGR02145 family)